MARPLPAVSLQPGGFWIASANTLAGRLVLSAQGGAVALVAPTLGKLHQYRQQINYPVAPAGLSSGRLTTADGAEHFPVLVTPTLQQPNSAPLVGPVVLSEVAYNAGNGLEFIELTNTSANPVNLFDPAAPANTWRLTGVFFQFPAGVTIPAGGKIVVTSLDSTQVCTDYQVADAVRILGPLPLPIADTSDRLALERPLTLRNGERLYTVVDEVAYTTFAPWPRSDEPGASLERLNLTGYGSEPLNWRRGGRANDVIQPAAQSIRPVDLCNFDATRAESNQVILRWTTRHEEGVTSYLLWRSADGLRKNAEQLTQIQVTGDHSAVGGGSYEWIDDTALPDLPYTYWLVATGTNNEQVDVAFTTIRGPVRQLYLPFVFH